jgi:hypothetical protein
MMRCLDTATLKMRQRLDNAKKIVAFLDGTSYTSAGWYLLFGRTCLPPSSWLVCRFKDSWYIAAGSRPTSILLVSSPVFTPNQILTHSRHLRLVCTLNPPLRTEEGSDLSIGAKRTARTAKAGPYFCSRIHRQPPQRRRIVHLLSELYSRQSKFLRCSYEGDSVPISAAFAGHLLWYPPYLAHGCWALRGGHWCCSCCCHHAVRPLWIDACDPNTATCGYLGPGVLLPPLLPLLDTATPSMVAAILCPPVAALRFPDFLSFLFWHSLWWWPPSHQWNHGGCLQWTQK